MKKIIGRTDKADFPELSLSNVNLKVDTGAFTSTIHSHEIEEVNIEGEKRIRFKILDPSHPKYNDKRFEVKRYRKRKVKSSFGTTEQRYVIQTVIKIFGEEYPLELSLSERSEMKFPILLGRRFLNKKFIIDPSKSNLSFKLKQTEKKKKTNNINE